MNGSNKKADKGSMYLANEEYETYQSVSANAALLCSRRDS